MSKHYEERYYTREEIGDDCDDYHHHRSSSRRRSTSRPRGGHGHSMQHQHQQHQSPPEEQYYRHRLARSGSGTSVSSMSDCEYRTQCSDRPMVRVPREVCRAPTPPPVIQRVVERAPTPEPDVVERVIDTFTKFNEKIQIKISKKGNCKTTATATDRENNRTTQNSAA